MGSFTLYLSQRGHDWWEIWFPGRVFLLLLGRAGNCGAGDRRWMRNWSSLHGFGVRRCYEIIHTRKGRDSVGSQYDIYGRVQLVLAIICASYSARLAQLSSIQYTSIVSYWHYPFIHPYPLPGSGAQINANMLRPFHSYLACEAHPAPSKMNLLYLGLVNRGQ